VSVQKKIIKKAERRARRTRTKIKTSSNLLRVSVFRSLNHIYAQIIDDAVGKTISSCSSLEMKTITGDKKAVAHAVGVELAKKAQEKGVTAAVFDRGSFLYHGRVKALAEGLREGGLHI